LGTIAWLRKRPDILGEYWWLGCWTTLWGWIGCGMGIYLFPIESEFTLRIMFLIFCILVLIYVLWMIWSDASGLSLICLFCRLHVGTLSKGGDVPKIINNLLGLACTGLTGGIIVAWISIGLDTITFVVLSYIFRVCIASLNLLFILLILSCIR
jgi:hypothetical protein